MTDNHGHGQETAASSGNPLRSTRNLALLLAGVLALAALTQIKWLPLGGKVTAALETPAIASSILSRDAPLPPPPSWEAGLGYTLDYFGAVWTAVALAILLGGVVMALAPTGWLLRYLGKSSFGAVLLGGASALPAMF